MKVRLYPSVPSSVEVEGCIFSTPESVDCFIRALELAKKTVWPKQLKPVDKKK